MKKLLYISLLLLPLCATAQTPAQEADAIQRRQLQDSQEMLRRRAREMAERAVSTPQAAQEATPAAGTAVSKEGCLDIARINISGMKKISSKKARARAANIIGPCITKEMLQAIQNDIQKLYVDRGYIAARIYFDFSAVKDKRLNIIIDEGRLEKIVLTDAETGKPKKGLRPRLQTATAFPFTVGRPLNLRDIEQGLEQLNRLQSNNAAMEVRPGTGEGDSVVVVSNELLPRNSVGLSYDNSGASNTGIYRGSATYSRDNLLALNENIFLNATTTLWNNRDLRYSNNYTASISLPFGYWTVNESINYSNYLTTTSGALASFESSGNSLNNFLSLERMVARGMRYKLALGAQLANKSTKNYLEDVYIETSSRRLTVGTLYMTGTYYGAGGSFYSKVSLNRGLPLMGAMKDEVEGEGIPKAQFTTAQLYLNYSRWFGPVSYTGTVDSQYGFDDLFGSEQMMLGGESTVRGFKEQNAFGESGFVIRQDIKIPLSKIFGLTENELLNTALQSTHLGAFIDYGYVAPKTYGDASTLAGAGGRLSCYTKYINGGFTYAKAILRPDNLPSEGNVFYFNVAMNIAF